GGAAVRWCYICILREDELISGDEWIAKFPSLFVLLRSEHAGQALNHYQLSDTVEKSKLRLFMAYKFCMKHRGPCSHLRTPRTSSRHHLQAPDSQFQGPNPTELRCET
ncbi:unnamed protein product, partial [Ilex paraguariensis]